MKKYLIIAISLLVSAGMKAQQQGEIFYREFERGCASFKDVPQSSFGLDMNNDSTCDFITYGDFYNSVSPMPTGFQVLSSDWEVTRCFNYHDIPDPSSGLGCVQWILDYFDDVRIDTLSNWHSTDYIAPYVLFPKLIVDTTFQHLIYGFRHKTNGNDTEQHYCYGWVECTIRWKYFSQQDINVYPYPQSTQSWLCVNRMAYCTIPDYPLRTGQTSLEDIVKEGNEWYYEIQNDDGSITYQHLECVGDTLFDRAGKRPKIIVRSNTHYNRNTITEVTHEYVYEESGIVYWWNKTLEEFTVLYDLNTSAGDEWEVKVGNESLTMHVDTVETIEHEGRTYRMLRVSDPEDLFSGSIVCGIGHLTSFFPEKLMNRGRNYRVEGMRCYWVGDELIYHNGEEDCDAIHSELQSLDETDIAAFIYTDFEPDTLVELKEIDFNPDAQMRIDFDAEGNYDLRIYARATSGGWWFYIMSYSPDWEIHEYPIGDSLSRMNEHGGWYTGINWLPYFYQGQDTISDKFAVRHQVGESYYYGWFRAYLLMNGTSSPWVALDKMAYCTIPDHPLTWGQTKIPEGVEDNNETNGNAFAVYPNPAKDILFVETRLIASLPDQNEYRITNLMGQTVLQGNISAETQQINIESLPIGMYFISMGEQTIKFVKQ